jgi:hypothetical protein
MTLETISGALIIALFGTLLFLIIAGTWHALRRALPGHGQFTDSIMLEAAQRFRDQFDVLLRTQSLYLAAAAVFLLLVLIAGLLGPQPLLSGLPDWQLLAMSTVVAVAGLYGLYRLVRVASQRRKIEFIRNANMATGHCLQRLTGSQNRLFHDVPCAAGIIDNVIVGPQGIYAISVIAKKPGRDKRVRLNGERLSFAPGKVAVSVADCGKAALQLASELGQPLGHAIRVRPVVVVPGWEIDAQSSDDYLVVNERNVSMLRGWKNQQEYLMNEDVEEIQKLLTSRCTRFKRR